MQNDFILTKFFFYLILCTLKLVGAQIDLVVIFYKNSLKLSLLKRKLLLWDSTVEL